MATAHLIHGYLGAGKSTYARRLAAETGAVLICIDEWYLRLYTDGTPTEALDLQLLDRLYTVLNDHWPRLLTAGIDVVLDFGYWTRQGRDEARALASAAAAAAAAAAGSEAAAAAGSEAAAAAGPGAAAAAGPGAAAGSGTAAGSGAAAGHRLHWVRTSDETALARCLKRNEQPEGTFLIDRDAYTDLKARYEAPGPDETVEIIET